MPGSTRQAERSPQPHPASMFCVYLPASGLLDRVAKGIWQCQHSVSAFSVSIQF